MLSPSVSSSQQPTSFLAKIPGVSHIPGISSFVDGASFRKQVMANSAQGIKTEESEATDITKSVKGNFSSAFSGLRTGLSGILSTPSKIGDGKHGNAIMGLAKSLFNVVTTPIKLGTAIPRGIASGTLGKMGSVFQMATSPWQDAKAIKGKAKSLTGIGSKA